jgi:hypothetical protein
MTMLTMSMHPSDETLSRLADQSEVERMRLRAGRHVARCARCAAEIAAIVALGDTAREMPDVPLPTVLLERIEASRRAGPPPADVNDPAGGAPERTSGNQRMRARWLTHPRRVALAAAAAIVVAALVAPIWHRHAQAAASHGEATMFPRYPRPGATVGIRFVPASHWSGRDTLWALGIVDLRVSPTARSRVGYLDVAAPLVRDRDGAYQGRVVLPDDALSGAITIWTAPILGPGVQRVAKLMILTAGATPDRPSLDAMESAVYNERSFMARSSLADVFARWAPNHPMRWLVADAAQRTGVFDWLRYFDSAERRFARLSSQLAQKKSLRAAEIAGMAGLAYQIEEPDTAAVWTDRLVREHPDDPAALDLRVQEIHQLELRRASKDSIRRLIPSLDTLFERNGGRIFNIYTLRTVVANNADSITAYRWLLREARAGSYFSTVVTRGREQFADPELRDSVEAFARDVLANRFLLEHGAPEGWFVSLSRPRAYASLASIALARGNYQRALGLTDSARVNGCIWPAQDTRALAFIASGDTADAVPLLAGYGVGGIFLTPDSAARILGSYFTPERWKQAVDSAAAVMRQCRHPEI